MSSDGSQSPAYDPGQPYSQAGRIRSYGYIASFTALIYHYLTTVDQEVTQIWPQPRWKLGKILFLTTRYSAMAVMIQDMVSNIASFAVVSQRSCQAFALSVNIAIVVTHTSAEATLWLCLYALLEGKRRYFYVLVAGFLILTVPMQTLQGFATMTQKAIPLDAITKASGYPCTFEQPFNMHLYAIGAYLSFARTLIAFVLAIATFVGRYRKQKNTLIKVIRREGGMYFLSTLVLKFFDGLNNTAGSPIEDPYAIGWLLTWVCVNVFAERLLLLMKNIEDPETQCVVSELMFAADPSDGSGETSDALDHCGGASADTVSTEEEHGYRRSGDVRMIMRQVHPRVRELREMSIA